MMGRIKDWRWWRTRIVEVTVALSLFYVSVNLIEYREAVRKSEIPASDWFVLDEIYIPDHAVGENPDMLYARTILEDHRGFWVVEAQRIDPTGRDGVFENACTGSGVNEYSTDEVLPNDTVTWEWFFGRPCTIPVGTYRVQLTRDMAKAGYPVKQMRAYSNVFYVTEK